MASLSVHAVLWDDAPTTYEVRKPGRGTADDWEPGECLGVFATRAEADAFIAQEQVDCMSHEEIAIELRRIGGPLNEAAANSILYLAAQEGLLEKAQQAAERAHAELSETKRPLDEQMARLNQRVVELNADADRLDFLDRTNARFRMGWKVGTAPAGNVSVQSVIHAAGHVIGIREAIDAARATGEQP